MLDKMKYLKANGKDYPMAFTLNVMENIQEEYGSMDAWAKLLEPESEIEPSIKDIKWTFKEFINEGIEIENEEKGKNDLLLSLKQVGRLISSIGLEKANKTIQEVSISSTVSEETKNE